MQAAPARYVSVSELYSTDEVELLLDEIRELEPTSCRGEDVQGAWTSAWSAASLAAGGALTLHAVLAAPEYRWAPAHLAHLLCSAAVSTSRCLTRLLPAQR
uniref:Uncharacterized protein n=1 Tax=Heliothis virescens TaxID=7102 RepID=A0A2A4JKJ8_HELVI